MSHFESVIRPHAKFVFFLQKIALLYFLQYPSITVRFDFILQRRIDSPQLSKMEKFSKMFWPLHVYHVYRF